jgi:hypothetical protein
VDNFFAPAEVSNILIRFAGVEGDGGALKSIRWGELGVHLMSFF